MSPNADPFLSRVHPLFWPVLWISLKWLATWTQREKDQGRGGWLVTVRVTWYGRIILVSHLAPDWNGDLARCSVAVETLLSEKAPAVPDAQSAIRDLLIQGCVDPTRPNSVRARLRAGLAGFFAESTGPP